MASLNNIMVENAHIMFRNFSGKESKFNKAGSKNFCVVIDDPVAAQKLRDDGWNMRILAPREEGDEPTNYLSVAVSYNNIPPKVWLIAGKHKTLLDEDTISTLDYAEIENVDLTIRPYSWEVNGQSGVKAYLKDMYVTIVEDPFAAKYAAMEGPDEEVPF